MSPHDIDFGASLPNIVEIVPKQLYAIGGMIPATRPLSFFPATAKGEIPVCAYVMKDGDNFLLVDTGIAIHRREIGKAMEKLIAGCTNRQMAMTRREPDNLINLPWAVKEFDIARVSGGGEVSPLDFFESMDFANADAQLKAQTGALLNWVAPGAVVEVGKFKLDVLRPALRVLATFYLYEHATETLFGAESWGFLTETSSHRGLIARADDRIGVDTILEYLNTKFDWIAGSDTAPLIDELKTIAARPIERICSNYGRVIEGRKLVRDVFDKTIEALEILKNRKHNSILGDFVWPPKAAAS